MFWFGRALGTIFGLMIAGPLGAFIGFFLGYHFDKGLNNQRGFYSHAQTEIQSAFFKATFSMMGHIAKADGRVTDAEIRLARSVMTQMGLSAAKKREAIKLFTLGKQPDFNLAECLADLKQACGGQHNLLNIFIEIQCQAAYADGALSQNEQSILRYICQQLGFSAPDFQHFRNRSRAEYRYQHHTKSYTPRHQLKDAYRLLNVSPDASDAEIKRAYRRQMSKNHPDKLVSKGLPEEMMKVATRKTQEIKAAYELIKKSKP